MTNTEAENKIIELLDEEFLKKLVEIGRLYGWNGDYTEISDFIKYLHMQKGTTVPYLEPYKTED